MTYLETYARWLDAVKDPALLEELNTIKGDDAQIKERFFADLPFGTAGLRGIIGAGVARMNRYVVGRATQGLANYLKKGGKMDLKMVIAYDSRRCSREFAREAACVLAGNGIKAYLFSQLTSVPELSFAVGYLKTDGGIVITASHNPRDYNGYKVYASYGGQLGPEESLKVMECIRELDSFADVKRADYEASVANGLIEEVGEEIDRAYYRHILELCGTDSAEDFAVVYTPLHGSGLRTAQNVFPAAGFERFYVVEAQKQPDGDFPTVNTPNPEDPTAMQMAIDMAKSVGAEIAIGTDPDADRMGAAVRREDGSFTMLTGNQIGCILTDYLLEKRRSAELLKPTDYVIRSFVSTDMAEAIAKSYGVTCHTVLTGFRFISEIIAENEGTDREFVFGFEESYGFLAGTFARDKDGVLAGLLLCKAAQHYRIQGKSLLNVLDGLYRKYGYYRESVKNLTFAGLDGMEKMRQLMTRLRERPIREAGGFVVTCVEDYQSRKSTFADGRIADIALPATDALKLHFEGGAWVCIRPSGTEPKIKIYFAVRGSTAEEAAQRMERLQAGIEKLV
jgi:phosphoglucomutase